MIEDILNNITFEKYDLVQLLQANGKDRTLLFEKSAEIKQKYVSNITYFRGLVEFSNICSKNCYYCGIRKGNTFTNRYNLDDDAILEAIQFAYEKKYGSIVLQSGERSDKAFVKRVSLLLEKIAALTENNMRITLSLGEQTKETYKLWNTLGAERYLLRIESTNEELFEKMHPQNSDHSFKKRLQALNDLKETGYQVGTGVMIGLPFQTTQDLAGDLLFMKDFDIDMVGMGPYIEHNETPLYEFKDKLMPIQERFDLALKMIATLRILMKDINIAAATALQAIDKAGREKAIKIGANVIMPNITPGQYRDDYSLYENKPCTDEEPVDCSNCLEARIAIAGDTIGYGDYGDSSHYTKRIKIV